jgi:hypothetical protein
VSAQPLSEYLVELGAADAVVDYTRRLERMALQGFLLSQALRVYPSQRGDGLPDAEERLERVLLATEAAWRQLAQRQGEADRPPVVGDAERGGRLDRPPRTLGRRPAHDRTSRRDVRALED